MPKSGEYWRRRFETLEEARHQNAARMRDDIVRQHNLAQREIESKIRDWYGRFAENNQTSLADARKLLNSKELAEFKWDVNEYIKRGQENAVDGRWMKELENASARFHISRLEELKLKTQNTLETLYAKAVGDIRGFLGRTYSEGYYRTAFEVQKGLGEGKSLAGLDEKRIQAALSKPWAADKATFSDRIWRQKDKLVDALHTQLTQDLILGRPPDASIKAVAAQFGTSRANAGRLVMTESAFIASAAEKDAYKDLDVERYEIIGTLDGETCRLCGAMDKQVFKMSEYEPGITAHPFHPSCRCDTAPYFDDGLAGSSRAAGAERAARSEGGEYYTVPTDMKYGEWKEKYVADDNSHAIINKEDNRGVNDRTASGYRRSPRYILSEDDIINLVSDVEIIGAEKSAFRFNHGDRTGFSDREGLINIRGDVFPDLDSIHPRDLMSARAVLAHEYYGHYKFSPSQFVVGDWRDEMRASYIAAIKTPGLSNEDRRLLMLDAYERAREAGRFFQYSKKAMDIIYGR